MGAFTDHVTHAIALTYAGPALDADGAGATAPEGAR